MTIPLRVSVIEIDNAIAGEEAAHKHRIAVPEPSRGFMAHLERGAA